MSVEISEVRRRVRAAIDTARKGAQERRLRTDQAARDYETFLHDRAVPVCHTVAAALTAEGRRFKVFTPAGTVRLASETSGEDFLEIALDDGVDPPAVVGRVSRGRGRRMISSERPLAEGGQIAQLTEEDVLAFLVSEIVPFVER